MINAPTLTVVVRDKERVLFNGQAQAVSSVNEKGPFDILAQHENFIALIKDKVVIHLNSIEKKEIQIASGITRVFDDKIFVYVNVKV